MEALAACLAANGMIVTAAISATVFLVVIDHPSCFGLFSEKYDTVVSCGMQTSVSTAQRLAITAFLSYVMIVYVHSQVLFINSMGGTFSIDVTRIARTRGPIMRFRFSRKKDQMEPSDFSRCPHARMPSTFTGGARSRGLSRFLLPLTGLACLVWMLVRVIPKPSRAEYPCMKVAAPLAGGFIAYIAGMTIVLFSFKKARHLFR